MSKILLEHIVKKFKFKEVYFIKDKKYNIVIKICENCVKKYKLLDLKKEEK